MHNDIVWSQTVIGDCNNQEGQLSKQRSPHNQEQILHAANFSRPEDSSPLHPASLHRDSTHAQAWTSIHIIATKVCDDRRPLDVVLDGSCTPEERYKQRWPCARSKHGSVHNPRQIRRRGKNQRRDRHWAVRPTGPTKLRNTLLSAIGAGILTNLVTPRESIATKVHPVTSSHHWRSRLGFPVNQRGKPDDSDITTNCGWLTVTFCLWHGGVERQRTQNITLLHSSHGIHHPHIIQGPKRDTVTPRSPCCECWDSTPTSREQRVLVQWFENIVENDGHAKLEHGCRVPVTVLRDCVDGCFQTQGACHAHMKWTKKPLGITTKCWAQALAGEPTQDFTCSDESYAGNYLCQLHQAISS